MDNGFIRVGAAVPKIKVADCKSNCEEIIHFIDEADENHVQLLVFPELCITAYSCGDLFYQDILLEEAVNGLQRILDHTRDKNILILLGMPLALDNQLFNCAVLILKGKILGVVAKTSIPNHGDFYEKDGFLLEIMLSAQKLICVIKGYLLEMIFCFKPAILKIYVLV